MKIFLIALLLFSCSKKTNKPKDTIPIEKSKLELLSEKAALYKSLQSSALDEDGWPTLVSPCDATGFLALCKTAGGCDKAEYFAAEEAPGKWQRNQYKNCVETGKSKTSISKDMLMMGFVYGLFGMDREVAKGYFLRLEAYGKANDWIMGYPSETLDQLGRVYMTPGMTLTLYDIIENITGTHVERQPPGYGRVPGGYQAHLRVLDVIIKGRLKGGIDTVQMADINELHDRDPRNALYQAVFHRYRDGEMSEVADILLDEKLFPNDRLPSSNDRCAHYLWERDQGKDWEPCDENFTHDAIDFLFAHWYAGFK